MTGLLSGCGATTSSPAPKPSPCVVKLRPTQSITQPVTIRWDSEERVSSIYTELIELFQNTPGNELITVQHIDSQDHNQSLNSLLHGQGPDVLSLDMIWIDEFARKKLLAPLSDRWSAEEYSHYFSRAMEAATVNGVVYAAPYRVDLGMLYYRTDVIGEAPQTWDQLTAVAQQAIDHQKTRYGYVWQGGTGTKGGRPFGEGLVCNFIEVLHSYGGTLDLNDPASLTQDAAVQALSEMTKWVGTISPISVTIFDEDESANIWLSGNAALMRNWPYQYVNSIKRDNGVAGKFAVAGIPHEKDHVGRSCLGGWYLAINKQSSAEKQEAAWRFIHWMMQEEAQKVAAKRNGWLVTLQSVYDQTSQDYPDLQASYPYFDQVPQLLEQAIARPRDPDYYNVSNIIQFHIHQALIRQQQPKQALQNLRKALQSHKPTTTKSVCGV